jgi:hypothetical protein
LLSHIHCDNSLSAPKIATKVSSRTAQQSSDAGKSIIKRNKSNPRFVSQSESTLLGSQLLSSVKKIVEESEGNEDEEVQSEVNGEEEDSQEEDANEDPAGSEDESQGENEEQTDGSNEDDVEESSSVGGDQMLVEEDIGKDETKYVTKLALYLMSS